MWNLNVDRPLPRLASEEHARFQRGYTPDTPSNWRPAPPYETRIVSDLDFAREYGSIYSFRQEGSLIAHPHLQRTSTMHRAAHVEHQRSSCPDGQKFCHDGRCHGVVDGDPCSDVDNACMCPGRFDIPRPADDIYYPCQRVSHLMNEYDYQNASQVKIECADRYQVKLAVLTSGYGSEATALLSCGHNSGTDVSWSDPAFIIFYVSVAVYVGCLLMWIRHKRKAEWEVLDEDIVRLNTDPSNPDRDLHLEDDSELRMRQWGYRDVREGKALRIATMLYSVAWMVICTFLAAQFYTHANSDPESSLLFTDVDSLSTAFLVMWHLMFIWFAVLKISELHVANFFRLRCSLATAEYVQVWVKRDKPILLAARSSVLLLVDRARVLYESWLGSDREYSTMRVRTTEVGTRYFDFECVRYAYTKDVDCFEECSISLPTNYTQCITEGSAGLSDDEVAIRRETVGPNAIEVSIPSVWGSLLAEFSSAFYVYQLLALWVWFYFNYWVIGVCLGLVIFTSGLAKAVLKHIAIAKVRRLAQSSGVAHVLRNAKWQMCEVRELVPGDVVAVEAGDVVPCDGLLLSGFCIVDESSLTGESLPQQKTPAQNQTDYVDKLGSSRQHFLFAGTDVVSVEAEKGRSSVFLFVRETGAYTEKGKLVQHMLHPPPVSFVFNEHMKVVIAILLVYGFGAFILVVVMMNEGRVHSWFYGVMAMTQILNPMLPAVFVVGQSVAAERMARRDIYCTGFDRITMAGKIRYFCFDKTGTLTKSGLDFYGAAAVDQASANGFANIEYFPESLPPMLQRAMACAHSVSASADGRFVGSSIDVEMFSSLRWQIESGGEGMRTVQGKDGATLKIVKVFEFDHYRAIMSVVAVDQASGLVHGFAKGSFEKLSAVCRPETVPSSYTHIANEYAADGCYVLAIAHRPLGTVGDLDATKVSRAAVENDLTLLGLLMFRNALKPDTARAMTKLRGGDVRLVMVTGDNHLTGTHIAREANMFESPYSHVVVGDLDGADVVWTSLSTLERVDVDELLPENLSQDTNLRKRGGAKSRRSIGTLLGRASNLSDDRISLVQMSSMHPEVTQDGTTELVITGRAFQSLVQSGSIRKYLPHTRVFARMLPQQKVQCVQLHMELGITGFCGDGGNDCGALRAAHCGIAFSEAEASIVSPFASKTRSVESCVSLLLEGRAALSTSFATYKFVIAYGQIVTVSSVAMYYFFVSNSMWVWIVADTAIIVSFAYTLSFGRPRQVLCPQRPTAQPLGAQTVASVCLMVLIDTCFIVFAIAMLFNQNWFLCHAFDPALVFFEPWEELGDNFEAVTISLVALYQLIFAAFVYNLGDEFRGPWYSNWALLVNFALLFSFVSYVTLADPNPAGCLLRINCGAIALFVLSFSSFRKDPWKLEELGYPRPTWQIHAYNSPDHHNVLPSPFRWKLFALMVLNFACVVACESLLVKRLVPRFIRRRRESIISNAPRKERSTYASHAV